jgi:hypothetical protein
MLACMAEGLSNAEIAEAFSSHQRRLTITFPPFSQNRA